MLDIYAAGETPIADVTGESLYEAIRAKGVVNAQFVAKVEHLPQLLRPLLRDQDILLTLGAGSIGNVQLSLLNDH